MEHLLHVRPYERGISLAEFEAFGDLQWEREMRNLEAQQAPRRKQSRTLTSQIEHYLKTLS
jgi:hypothetical protein